MENTEEFWDNLQEMLDKAEDHKNTQVTIANWYRLHESSPEFRNLISPVQWAIAASISNGDLAIDYRGEWNELVSMTNAWGIDK